MGFDPSYQGAFAEYIRVPAAQLLAVPDGLSLREAALTEPLTVALHALDVAGAAPGDRVLVTGAGPIGLLVVAALRAAGVDDVRVSEPGERRRELAGKVGATRALDPRELETPPMPFTVVDDPVDVVFECSGDPAAMESGLAQLAPMGRLVIVGTGLRRPRLDHNRILMNELVVTGSYCHGEGGYERAIELLASGRLPSDALIEPIDVALTDLFPALERLEAGELAGKVMIIPREDP
jgi:(R,R)-butanediol dehydrogenase/meso-butanediol dehydrogenase/diacetyl reductase